MGHAVDQNLLSLVQQDVKKLSMDTEGSLAQQRVDLAALQKSVTSIQDQQAATGAQLKEHDEQLTAVLEWKEQKMKETREILLKLVSVEKMLSEELLIRVEGVEQSVEGMEQRVEVVEQRVEGMEQSVEGMEQRVEVVQQSVEGVEQSIEGMEQRVEGMEQRVKGMEQSVEGVEQSVEGMEQRVEVVEQRFEGMEKGNVERDDKMEQLEQGFAKVEKKVKQLEETGRSQRMKDNKPG